MKGRKILPIDPRPSRADPEHRRLRKELEKEHNYEWVPPIVLGLLGITLAWDVAKDVSKCEERKEKEEKERKERDERRRSSRRGRYNDYDDEEDDEDEDGGDRRRRRRRGRSTDAGLDRADRLEGGDDKNRKRRSSAYDNDYYYDQAARLSGRRGRDDEGYYDYEYDDRGRSYDDTRASRPRPRRRSSDW